MALRIGDLVGLIRADDSGMRHGLTEAEMRMAGFQRDVNGRLRDLHGHFIAEGDAMGRAIAAGLGDGSDEGMRRLRTRLRAGLRQADNDTDRGMRAIWRRIVNRGGQTGDDSGRSLGGRMLSTLTRTLRNGISAAFEAGMSGLRGAMSAISSNPYVAGIGVALAAAIAATALPLIGALISGGVIAVGALTVVGIGAALLKNEPEVKKAAERLKKTVKDVFANAAKPMAKPLADALNGLAKTAKDIAPQIDQAFRTVAESGIIKSLTDGLDKLVKNALPGFNDMLKRSGPVFEGIKTMLSRIGMGLGAFFKGIGDGAPGAKKAFEDIGAAIAFMLFVAGTVIGKLGEAYEHVRKFISDVIGGFQWLYDKLVGHSIIPDLVNEIIAWFAGLPRRALNVLSGLGPGLARLAGQAMDSMVGSVKRGLDSAVRWLSGLPGRAGRALGRVGGTLYSAGQSLIRGFINGMLSQLGGVVSAVSKIVGKARDYFPFSPAKEGPFSGRGYTLHSGRALIEGFQRGIADRLPSLRAQLHELGSGLPDMGVPSYALPGGGLLPGGGMLPGLAGTVPQAAVNVRIVVDGPEAMTRLIRGIVQDKGGGNVQLAFGR